MSDDRQSKIEKRAFEIWQREGCPDGQAEEHWRLAAAEIAAEEARASERSETGTDAAAAPREQAPARRVAEKPSQSGTTAAEPAAKAPPAAKAKPSATSSKAEPPKADAPKKVAKKKK